MTILCRFTRVKIQMMKKIKYFELMYSQARLKGIRLRDHPSFVDAVMNLLEEASELDRLNSNNYRR